MSLGRTSRTGVSQYLGSSLLYGWFVIHGQDFRVLDRRAFLGTWRPGVRRCVKDGWPGRNSRKGFLGTWPRGTDSRCCLWGVRHGRVFPTTWGVPCFTAGSSFTDRISGYLTAGRFWVHAGCLLLDDPWYLQTRGRAFISVVICAFGGWSLPATIRGICRRADGRSSVL